MIESPEIVTQYLEAGSFRALGKQRGMSYETARLHVQKAVREFTTQVAMDLLTAQKIEAMGGAGDWPGLVVPHQAGDGWRISLDLLQIVVDRLRDMNFDIEVRTRPTPNGSAFVLFLREETH